MNVFFTIASWVIVYVIFSVESKKTEDSDIDHEDVGSVDYTNASMYTTSEMMDKVLAEWKGRTDEIQGYFDQLPSEEFKENSEDLKLQHYYERKGAKGVRTGQVFNITPQQYHEPHGPMYTIEVNDSYVPKYRITTSEEDRMEKYGTFNSESESSEVESEVKKKKKKKKKESSESGDENAKTKKEKKAWPSNMDPKEKRKKKKPKTAEDETKRKDLVRKTLNGVNKVKVNIKKIEEEKLKIANREDLQNKLQGSQNYRKYGKTKDFLNKIITNKIQNKQIKTKKNKVDYKPLDNSKIENKLENLERKRKRSRQSINGYPLRPYL